MPYFSSLIWRALARRITSSSNWRRSSRCRSSCKLLPSHHS
nr:MAG TPA: hypothetical protein [Caudoviricetes sp.]